MREKYLVTSMMEGAEREGMRANISSNLKCRESLSGVRRAISSARPSCFEK